MVARAAAIQAKKGPSGLWRARKVETEEMPEDSGGDAAMSA